MILMDEEFYKRQYKYLMMQKELNYYNLLNIIQINQY